MADGFTTPPEGIYSNAAKFQNGYPTKDWLCESNAEELAGRIRRYWERQRMTPPAVQVERVLCRNKNIFILKSDMINGMPR